ncbi:uncharacterized protein LOC121248951 [Juglans microcarpa x Juglans regia]|uniref:uncharacterized protein LOC121248951 n=1 Tax=Juglans microcarpa x Juglans regia TaxID=2249226 RepID=UPI001B7D9A54|nr:uncharacterized protein LOC121248951 [Juglans microcarpa x Juglans regia]
MKIQPVDSHTPEEFQPVKPVVKSRLKQLFEWQFPNVLRISAAKKVGVEEPHFNKDGCNGSSTEFEPSSLCLSKMVQNFIEENNEKQSCAIKCGRNRCNCFNRKCTDNSEDDLDFYNDSNFSFSTEALEFLKGLVPCASVWERKLLADTAKIVEKNKICKRKDEFCRNVVTDGLLAMGYDASVCKSRWEKSPSHPSGQYEYIDVIMGGERYLIDIDFRSEFEIARSTKSYKAILQSLPYIFVGKTDRLQKIIGIVSEAAKQSLKKKGMHIPPWRKEEYVKAKWLSPHPRCMPSSKATPKPMVSIRTSNGESGRNGGEGESADEIELGESVFAMAESGGEEDEKATVAEEWKPPEVKPKGSLIGVRIVTGLASVIEQD